MNRGAIAVISALAMLVAACGKEQKPVPRPDAWPRIDVYPQAYHPLEGAMANFEVNDSTRLIPSDNPRWVTLDYPRYNAQLFITFTETDSLENVVANRAERMALNAGNTTSELTELESEGGYHAQLMSTPRGTITPLQFLAVDGRRRVVSGALMLSNEDDLQRPDSLAPMLRAVEADLIHALKHLR